MIEKKEEVLPINDDIDDPAVLDEDSSPILSPADNLAESCQSLENAMLRVQDDITKSFARFSDSLKSREKQLLRQVDVLYSQQLALIQSIQAPDLDAKAGHGTIVPQVLVNLDRENDLTEHILSFGNVSLESGSLAAIDGNTSPYSVPYKSEDYQDADSDHVCLYKPLSGESTPQHQVIRFGFAPKLSASALTESSKSNEVNAVEADVADGGTEPKTESDASETEKRNGAERRPSQVQHWLEQIKIQTETEPSVGEMEKKFDETNTSLVVE